MSQESPPDHASRALADVSPRDSDVHAAPNPVRSVLTGMVVGAMLSACNIYSGLKVGWSSNMSVTGALVSFAVWRARPKARAARAPFTILEANLAQTAASSAAAVSSAGLVAGIPALTLLTGLQLPWYKLALWVLSVCLVGIMIAVPLRRQLIVNDPLPFPMGVATAETLTQMYAKGREAMVRVAALGVAAISAGALKVLETFQLVKAIALPGAIAGQSLKSLTFGLEPSLLLVGVGGIMGTRACVSVFLGALVAYGVLGPILLDTGLVAPGKPDKAWYKELVGWLLWPGVTLMVVSSLAHLVLSWRTLARGLMGVGALEKSERSDREVPNHWLLRGVGLAAAFSLALQIVFFGIPWWAALMGLALSGVLAVVGARVAGETGVTPIGAMGKVTQLAVGAALPGDVTANLMTANVTGGAASQCADLMNDLKTGQLLRSSPRQQFLAQLAGALSGAAVGSAIYLLLIPNPKQQLITPEWAAPAVVTWKTVAEVFRSGLSALPDKTPLAVGIAAVVAVALVLAEARGPKKLRAWVPSPSAFGLAFVVPANQSLSIFIGGMLALAVTRARPNWTGRFWIVICSGVIAGEGLVGAGLSIHQMLK